jgi:hypothetical protein
MRRCGVMKLHSSSNYPLQTSVPSIDDSTFSRCLSWRLLPVIRIVLSIQEASGSTSDKARELMLDFLQAVISDELSSGIVGASIPPSPKPSSSSSNTNNAPSSNNKTIKIPTKLKHIQMEHRRQIVLRIIASLGRVIYSEDVRVTNRISEMYCVLLIAIANNHDITTLTSTNQNSNFITTDMMRPIGVEKPDDTCRRILALLEGVLMSVPVGNGGGTLPIVPNCIKSQKPSLVSDIIYYVYFFFNFFF